jgi:hypothetical protein
MSSAEGWYFLHTQGLSGTMAQLRAAWRILGGQPEEGGIGESLSFRRWWLLARDGELCRAVVC